MSLMPRAVSKRQGRRDWARGTRLIIISLAALIALVCVLQIVQPSHKEAGLDLILEGDFETAEKILDRVVSTDKNDLESRYYLGICRFERRDFKAALEQFTYLRVAPEWQVRAFYQIVKTHMESGTTSDAEAEITHSDQLPTTSPLVQEARGLYYLWRMNEVIAQMKERLSGTLGSKVATSLGSRATRIVYADAKVYGGSLDRFLLKLHDTGYSDREQIETMLDRAHRDLISAFAALDQAARLADEDESRPEVPQSRYELARILEIRGRVGLVEKQRLAIIATSEDRLQGDRAFQRILTGLVGTVREQYAESLVSNGRFQAAIDFIKSIPNGKGEGHYAFDRILAMAFDALGDRERTLVYADRWLQENTNLGAMNFLRGKYHFERREFEESVVYFEKAVGKRLRSREYGEFLARNYLVLNRFDRANSTLERILELSPDDWQIFLLRIRAMEGMGWIDDARRELTKAISGRFKTIGSPANRGLRVYLNEFLNRYEMAPKDLYIASKLYSEDSRNYMVGRSYLELLIEKKSFKTARRVAKEMSRECPVDDPEYFGVMLACARLYNLDGQHDEAIRLYQSAAAVSPADPRSYLGQARCHLANQRIGSAWEAVRKVEILDSRHAGLSRVRFDLKLIEGDATSALEEAEQMLVADALDFSRCIAAAQTALELGKGDRAREFLGRINEEDLEDPADIIEMSVLKIRSNQIEDGERALEQLVLARPDKIDLALEIASKLSTLGRPESVLGILGPLAAADLDIDWRALRAMAASYKALGDDHRYLETLVRLVRQGRRTIAFTEAMNFCFERGASLEVMSIAEAAAQQKIHSSRLFKQAAELALRERDLTRARRFERLMRSAPDSPLVDRVLLDARILDARDRPAEALAALAKARDELEKEELFAVRRLEIELLARRNQTGAVLESLGESAPEGLLAFAGRELMRLDAPEALSVLTRSITLHGQNASALVDQGLIAMDRGDLPEAIRVLEAAWKIDPVYDTGFALSVASAIKGDRSRMAGMLRQLELMNRTGPARAVANLAYTILHANTSKALAAVDALPYPSRAERSALHRLVAAGLADKKTAVETKRQIPLYWFFQQSETTLRMAMRAIVTLRPNLPALAEEIDLLKARALISMPSSRPFETGMKIVAGLLDRGSPPIREAALCIYAEHYLAQGRTEAMSELIRFVLTLDGLSTEFCRDIAKILMLADLPLAAVKVLYRSPHQSPESTRTEARALYRDGNLERAARLLIKTFGQDENDATYCQIVGEFLSRDENTVDDGYRLAAKAVYDHGAPFPSCYLSLARVAFRRGEAEEARKNVEKYIGLDASSARLVAEAVEVVDEFASDNLRFRDRLDNRRALLDPSGFLKKKRQ